MKKLLFLTVLTMLFAVNAAADTKNGTIPGTSIDWTYDTGTYTLTLSGSGEIPSVSASVGKGYFASHNDAYLSTVKYGRIEKDIYITDDVATIKITGSITKLGNFCFADAELLETVILNPQVKEIGEKAFRGCEKLIFFENIPEDIVIHQDAFEACPNLFNSGVLILGNTLVKAYPEENYLEYDIPSTVTKINPGAFSEHGKLTKITIPASVKTIGKVFDNCVNLTTVTFNGDINSIGDEAFTGCSKLTTVTFNGNINSIGNQAFANCSALNDINIPSTVTTWGDNIFKGCINLPNDGTYQKAGNHVIVKVYDKLRKKYTISSDITYIEPGIFDNSCTNIKYLIYEGTSAPKITNGSPITTAAANKIESTVVPSGKESLYSADHGPNINTTKVNINTNKYTSYTFLHDVVVPDYVGVYVAESSDGEFVELKRVNKVNDKFKIKAGQGVFLRAQENKLYTFESTKGQATNDLGTNLIKGVTEDTEFNGTEKAYILQTIDGKQKLYEIRDYYSLPMCKAYLDGSTLANVKSFSLRESNDDETAITETTQDTSKAREYIYNLSGQKLSTMQEGLNIVNGKIVIN